MTEELAKPTNTLMQFGNGQTRMATSLDLTQASERVKMLKAFQDCDFRLTQAVNIPIHVTDYVVHDVDITSKETGEIVTCTRLVLVDADGATYECVSGTLLQSLKTVAFCFGPPPWSPPRTLTVKMKSRGTGKDVRNIYWFDATE